MATPRDIDARKFRRVAVQRLEEAELIAEKLELWSAAEYLGGYAIECALKALVILVTPVGKRPAAGEKTTEWLKKAYGHNLNLIRRDLSKHGARMPSSVATDFLYVSTWDPQSRYEPGPGDPDSTGRFLMAARSVLEWAEGRMT